MKVNFYESVADELLKFAVIISKHNGKWVFCKHKERDTYEVPGGHREEGESILDTAKRELNEETGARLYSRARVRLFRNGQKQSQRNRRGNLRYALFCRHFLL